MAASMHVVAGLALRGTKVFMQRRPLDKLRPGLWEHPGGKVEPGEEEPEALAREWAEELAWRNDVGVDLPVSIVVGRHLATVSFEVEVPITIDLYEVDLRRDLTLQTLNARLVSREGCHMSNERDEKMDRSMGAMRDALEAIAGWGDCLYAGDRDRERVCPCPVCRAKRAIETETDWRVIGARNYRCATMPREALIVAAWRRYAIDGSTSSQTRAAWRRGAPSTRAISRSPRELVRSSKRRSS